MGSEIQSGLGWVDSSPPCGIEWGHLVVFNLWRERSGVLEVFIHISGTVVGTVRRLGPGGSLFLPMYSQDLPTWSLQEGSWTHIIAQGSKSNGSKGQEVDLPVS